MGKLMSLITVFLFLFCTDSSGSKYHKKLIDHLFSHYDSNILPTPDPKEPVHLSVENIHLRRITNIDEIKGTVDIGLWVGLTWNDTELSWSPLSYGGVDKLSVRAAEIWIPDIHLFSGWGVSEVSLRDSEINDVILMSTGQIYYFPNVKLILPCLNKTESGDLECNFAFGSWTLLEDMLDLHLLNTHLDISSHVIDPKYQIKNESLEEKTVIIPAYPDEPWELIITRIKLDKVSINTREIK